MGQCYFRVLCGVGQARSTKLTTRERPAIRADPFGTSDDAALETLGRRLARHRLNRNLTQAALAAQAGVSTPTVQRIEQGHSSQAANLIRILRAPVTVAEVRLWGRTIGAVSWGDDRGFAHFEYDPALRIRLAAAAAARPMTVPAATSAAPCPITSPSTSARCAPSAIRIAISPRLCATL